MLLVFVHAFRIKRKGKKVFIISFIYIFKVAATSVITMRESVTLIEINPRFDVKYRVWTLKENKNDVTEFFIHGADTSKAIASSAN